MTKASEAAERVRGWLDYHDAAGHENHQMWLGGPTITASDLRALLEERSTLRAGLELIAEADTDDIGVSHDEWGAVALLDHVRQLARSFLTNGASLTERDR